MKFRQSAVIFPGAIVLVLIFACALIISTVMAPLTVSAQKNEKSVSDEASKVPAPDAIPGSSERVVTVQHVVDMNGDGKTDFSVVRDAGPSAQATWYTQYNGLPGTQTNNFGLGADTFVPGDFDGDNKSDIAVWRPGAPGSAAWYILQSLTMTVRTDVFGQDGDDPSVVGDYDNDGKDDVAVYRAGTPSAWYWRQAVGGPVFGVQWGTNGDFPAPGDYDGDGKNDFCVQRPAGNGQANFWTLFAAGGSSLVTFGVPLDTIVPGDYDGDGKTDIALVRAVGGSLVWFVRPSTAPTTYTQTTWGLSAGDYVVQGDYDGDGKTDQAVWRPTAPSSFYVNGSMAGFQSLAWGQNFDYPVANYNSR